MSLLGKAAGHHLHALAHNQDPRPVHVGRRRGSIGSQSALGRSRTSAASIDATLLAIVDRVTRRMRAARRVGRTVTLRLRFDDFTRATRSHTLAWPTAQTQPILATVRDLMTTARPMIRQQGLTLVGVAVGNLENDSAFQLPLPFERRSGAALDAVLDDVRTRFGTRCNHARDVARRVTRACPCRCCPTKRYASWQRMPAEPILQVQDLTKLYGSFRAVDRVSFELHKGRILGLLGPNGAGKTTTIQMLVGITLPDGGSIRYFGLDLHRHRVACLQRINFSSSYNMLQGRITVWENLVVYARLYRLSDPEQKIRDLGAYFGITELMNQRFLTLSAGQKTRVNLVKALLNDPEIILMDEPTASLDPDIADRTLSLIESLRDSRELAIVYTSHQMDEVTRICDEVIFLDRGRIVAQDTPESLTKRIANAQVRVRFEGEPRVDCQRARAGLRGREARRPQRGGCDHRRAPRAQGDFRPWQGRCEDCRYRYPEADARGRLHADRAREWPCHLSAFAPSYCRRATSRRARSRSWSIFPSGPWSPLSSSAS